MTIQSVLYFTVGATDARHIGKNEKANSLVKIFLREIGLEGKNLVDLKHFDLGRLETWVNMKYGSIPMFITFANENLELDQLKICR